MSTEPIVYEFKLRSEWPKHDRRWESAPVHFKQHFRAEIAPIMARGLAMELANTHNCEVRYNEQGSLQGHYESPNDKS